ncbi:hypothetical protein ABLT48_09650 [Acinetobacter ursingii]
MEVKDLKDHYGCKTRRDLHKKLGFSEVTLWKWEKFGIPPRTQASFEIQSNGKLKADRQALSA